MRTVRDRVTRRVRLYRPDRNPLRRRSDRWEALVVALATGLVLLALWPAALAGAAVYRDGLRAEASGPGIRERVVVTLVETPAGAREWRTDQGVLVTGRVAALTDAAAGTSAIVWIDGHGAITTRPRLHAEVVLSAVLAVLWVELGAIVVALVGHRIARRALDRGRHARWDAAWATAGSWRRGPHRT
ncbi:hypothetical protein ABGB17_21635 [Sphaerisporangium sp. B11E5]|uniref:Rv1733c family protein n=1 Tax=Sphaerisporangium sp. B11E5 TaxID=3153563 RepID=UPI00325CF1A7